MKSNSVLHKFEQKHLEGLKADKQIPQFSPGDTLKVNVKIREGERERVQTYEGVCIARSGGESDINASFTVRKISLGEGVERVFPLFSPRIESIELVRRGSVRRAKLYFLRDRRGKSARISERTTGHGFDVVEETAENTMTKTQKVAAKKEAKNAAKAEARKGHEAKAQAKIDAKNAEIAAAQAAAKAEADAKAAEEAAAAAAANAEGAAE